MKALIQSAALNLAVLMISALVLSFLIFNWFNSLLFASLFFIGFWGLIYFYPKGGRKVRRVAVDKITTQLIVQKEIKPFSCMSNWLKGVGVLSDTNQPMWVSVNEEGILLYFLCYRKKPPVLLPWDNIFSIKLAEKNGESYASLSINHFNDNFSVPWQKSFYIPEYVKKS